MMRGTSRVKAKPVRVPLLLAVNMTYGDRSTLAGKLFCIRSKWFL